jgi:CRP/FNR family cyclic AMP-dependent transcriptional regulator
VPPEQCLSKGQIWLAWFADFIGPVASGPTEAEEISARELVWRIPVRGELDIDFRSTYAYPRERKREPMDPKRLQSIPLFAGLSRKELRELGKLSDEVDLPAGKHLVEQGEFSYEFFVIESGTADVAQKGQHIATLGPGDFFGEIGLVRSSRRTASVVAASPMTLIVMGRREFSAMQDNLPHVAEAIRKKIEERLSTEHKA